MTSAPPQPLSDAEAFERVIYWEACGEGFAGMFLVACVVWNRHTKWRQSLQEVILGPNQFTSMAGGGKPLPATPEADQARAIAQAFLAGTQQKDVSNGALYYWNPKISTSTWFKLHIAEDKQNHPLAALAGDHEFFK